MRILGFSQKWTKLKQHTFTTFRFERRDIDWHIGERVQVVYKPRSKEREILGTAKIVAKEKRWVGWASSLIEWIEREHDILPHSGIGTIGHKEAVEDGFAGVLEMVNWLAKTHKDRNNREPMNKLTVTWILTED